MPYSIEKHKEFFAIAANGNVDAYNFLLKMASIFRLWDDCVDGDKRIDPVMSDDVFSALSFEFNQNMFYRRFQDELSSFIFVAWNAWKDSNEWRESEKTSKIQGICAWFIRDFCNEIVPLVAFFTGGKDHARSFSLSYRAFLLDRLAAGGVDGFIKE